eukprot:Skav226116  [mRNA]  locus=scaffold1047:41389:42507:- [translate_table: standard]
MLSGWDEGIQKNHACVYRIITYIYIPIYVHVYIFTYMYMTCSFRSKRDLSYGLQAMNLFYNFGVKLKHREISTRLVAATMMAREESEAVELIKLYGTWLEHPPDSAVVYAVMSKFLDDNKATEVRELAKVVREDWRFRLEAPLWLVQEEA